MLKSFELLSIVNSVAFCSAEKLLFDSLLGIFLGRFTNFTYPAEFTNLKLTCNEVLNFVGHLTFIMLDQFRTGVWKTVNKLYL